MGDADERREDGVRRQRLHLARALRGRASTLKAYNVNGGAASFGTKDMSFKVGATNYKYGGIGVSASGGRDAETDFVSPTKAERIEATFATALGKVTVGVAALFGGPGAAYDGPYTENLIWKAYDAAGALIGQGTVSGTANGLAQFTIEIPGASIKRISLTPGENSAGVNVSGREFDFLLQYIDGGASDSAKEVFTYKLEDANGDQSSAKLSITVNDAVPANNAPHIDRRHKLRPARTHPRSWGWATSAPTAIPRERPSPR